MRLMWTHNVGLMWTHLRFLASRRSTNSFLATRSARFLATYNRLPGLALIWTHVGLIWTHVGLMWTHVGLMWTHLRFLASRRPANSFLATRSARYLAAYNRLPGLALIWTHVGGAHVDSCGAHVDSSALPGNSQPLAGFQTSSGANARPVCKHFGAPKIVCRGASRHQNLQACDMPNSALCLETRPVANTE